MAEESSEFDSIVKKEINEKKKNELMEKSEESLNRLDKILKKINLLIEKEKKNQNFLKSDAFVEDDIHKFYESSNSIYKNIDNNLLILEDKYKALNLNSNILPFSNISENLYYLDMIKINNEIIALRKNNLIKFYNNNIKDKFNNKEYKFDNKTIIFFCPYEKKGILVSLKGNDNKNTIQLIDIETNNSFQIFENMNEIIYLSNGEYTNNIYAILDSNELIWFKDKNIEKDRKKFQNDDIKCLIEISSNILFIGSKYSFIFYDMENKRILHRNVNKTEEYNPKYCFFKDNYIFFGGYQKIYVIDSKNYNVQPIRVDYSSFIACDKSNCFCFYDDNTFNIYEYSAEIVNFFNSKKTKYYNKEKKINSIIFKSNDELLLLFNNRDLVRHRLNI